MKSKIIAAISLAAILSLGAMLPSEAKTFKNCTDLRKTYKYGVALSSKSANKGTDQIFTPKVSPALYKANKSKDADKDGIACEVTKPKVVAKPIPAPVPTEQPLPVITLDALDPKATNLVAQQLVAAAIASSSPVSESLLSVQSGPSLSQQDLGPVKNSVLTAVKLFRPVVLPEKVNVNWFTGADADWVDDAIRNSGANPNATPTRESYSSWIRSLNSCNMGNAGIGSKGPYINQCLKGAPATHETETASHEYFHTVQSSTMTWSSLPHWFIEGSATLVGIHVGGNSAGEFKGTRAFTVGRWTGGLDQGIRDAVRTADANAIVQRFKDLQGSQAPGQIQTSGYALGMFLTEALVASKGFDHWVEYLTTIKSLGFAQATEKSYGLTLDQLYVKVAPYVISQLKGN